MSQPSGPSPTSSPEETLKRHTAENLELAKRIDNLNTQIQLLAGITTAKPNSRPRQVLPAPATFDGTRAKWDTWNAYIKAKLDVDGEAIGNSKAQYWFVYGCLDSKVQALILHTSNDEATPDLILTALAREYDNPNKASEAAERLPTISQDNDESFNAAFARFKRGLGARAPPRISRVDDNDLQEIPAPKSQARTPKPANKPFTSTDKPTTGSKTLPANALDKTGKHSSKGEAILAAAGLTAASRGWKKRLAELQAEGELAQHKKRKGNGGDESPGGEALREISRPASALQNPKHT